MSLPRTEHRSSRAILTGFAIALAFLATGTVAAQGERTGRRVGVFPADRTLPPLFLKSHIVQAGIQGRLAHVSAESVYQNDTARDLEAFYTFPLPDGAALDRFVLWMDGEPVEAKVAEKQRARQTYERIVRKMQDPGLLEQVGENLFRYRIYPVKARSEQRVRIEYSYVLPLDVDERTLRFEYPLATTSSPQDSSRVAKDFALTVKLELDGAIASVESPSHKVSRHIDPQDQRKASVSIENAFTALDQDFLLAIQLKEKTSPLTSLAYRAAPVQGQPEEEGVVLLMITPNLPGNSEPPGKDVLMVMDTSGSMEGVKLEQARGALHQCLNRLRPNDRFGLISFSDNTTVFVPEWRPATREQLELAGKFVDRLSAQGSTDIGQALKATNDFKPSEGRLRQVLFATDGQATVGEQDVSKLLASIPAAEENGKGEALRFFTFGIGFDVNTRLLDGMAERTHGERAYVGTDERIDRKIAALCDKIAAPVLTDVSLEFSPELSVTQIYPRVPKELYAGRPLTLAARYGRPSEGFVKLRGKHNGIETVITAPLALPQVTGEITFGLARQWAIRKVGFLLDNIRLHGDNAELKDEVIRLGTRYSIVTPYTSFLALEKKDRAQFDDETRRLAQERRASGQAQNPNLSASAAPTDPSGLESTDITVPPDILAQARLDDRWETNNPDRPDTRSSFGNPDAHLFYSDEETGGGGATGGTHDTIIGEGSPGNGGGWGGGDGTGIGTDSAPGRGSFGARTGGGRRWTVMRNGGSRASEASVERALKWLATHQQDDGHWDGAEGGARIRNEVPVTGLALLAFLGAGHTEKVGAYKENVRRAVAWLIAQQKEKSGLIHAGDVANEHKYMDDAHLLAGLALAEASGMARVRETVTAAQKALDCSVAYFNAEAFVPAVLSVSQPFAEGRPSVGWLVMQLKSAKIAGLQADQAIFENVIRFLERLERKAIGAAVFCNRSGEPHEAPTPRCTALAIFARQILGWKREDLQDGVNWFIREGGLPGATKDRADLQYWYFGTLSAFQQGGDVWKSWNEAMKTTLGGSQCAEGDAIGSWEAAGEGAAEWGRAGQTALNALCLEIYYRYSPLYGRGREASPVPERPAVRPVDRVPSSETGREAVEYSEYLRKLQEGQAPTAP